MIKKNIFEKRFLKDSFEKKILKKLFKRTEMLCKLINLSTLLFVTMIHFDLFTFKVM